MSEYTKTIGTVTSFDGATVTIGTDCDLVTIACPPGGVRLTREQRDEMDRLMFTADAEAEAWERENEPPHPVACDLAAAAVFHGRNCRDPYAPCTAGFPHDATQCNGVHLEASDL